MSHIMIAEAMKAVQWERAKGELRALVALQSSYPANDEFEASRAEQLEDMVEAFIRDVQDEGLVE